MMVAEKYISRTAYNSSNLLNKLLMEDQDLFHNFNRINATDFEKDKYAPINIITKYKLSDNNPGKRETN